MTPIERLVASHKDIRETYKAALALNAKQLVSILQSTLAKTSAIEAVRWNQSRDFDGDLEFGFLQIKFVKTLFPANEELDYDRYVDDQGFTGFSGFEVMLERGMDVMNFQELAHVEKVVKEIEEINAGMMYLRDGLVEAYGLGNDITVTRSSVEVTKL